jgi:hypothetical protein
MKDVRLNSTSIHHRNSISDLDFSFKKFQYTILWLYTGLGAMWQVNMPWISWMLRRFSVYITVTLLATRPGNTN